MIDCWFISVFELFAKQPRKSSVNVEVQPTRVITQQPSKRHSPRLRASSLHSFALQLDRVVPSFACRFMFPYCPAYCPNTYPFSRFLGCWPHCICSRLIPCRLLVVRTPTISGISLDAEMKTYILVLQPVHSGFVIYIYINQPISQCTVPPRSIFLIPLPG